MRILSSLIIAAALISPVLAEEAGPKPEAGKEHAKGGGFGALDTDKDGALSAAEIAAITKPDLKAKLLSFDADQSGDLSADELAAMKKAGKEAREKSGKADGEKAEKPDGDKHEGHDHGDKQDKEPAEKAEKAEDAGM